MRILTFTTLFPSRERPDFGVFIFQRASHLARRPAHVVHVVAPVPYFPHWIPSQRWGIYGRIPSKETVGNLNVYHPRYFLLPGLLMPLHGLLLFLGSFLLVRRLHKQLKFECIDAHYVYPDGFAAVLLGKLLRLPVIVSARGTDINVFPSLVMIRPQIVWALRHAAGVIAVSTALRDAMIRLGLPAERVCVIPNGVDGERFLPFVQAEARRKLGLPLHGKIILSVGSLTPGKNHRLLITSFGKISSRNSDERLYILGAGPLRSQLEELIRELHLAEKVSLVGARPNEELALWYSSADLSCLVSSREGWPNVLMESIACGTPVVATRVGGIPEIITSPDIGVLVEPDPDRIAAGLEYALQKNWDRHALAQHAKEREWDKVAMDVELYLASSAPASSS